MENKEEKAVLSWTAKMDSRMKGDVVALELLFEDGEIVQRLVRFSDFRSVINEAVEGNELMHLPKLPRGYMDGWISTMEPETFQCTVHVPAGKKTIRYYETIYEVPYPATVFAFYVDRGRLTHSRVYFLKDGDPDENAVCYQYCFGNVDSFKGEICWGGNVLPQLHSMEDCNKLVALFFGSPCNDDYYSYARFREGAPDYCKTQRALYEHLQTCEKFPDEILAGTAYVVSDLLKKEEM